MVSMILKSGSFVLRVAFLCPGLLAPCTALAAHGYIPPVPAAQTKGTSVGDIRILKYKRLELDAHNGYDVTFTGPDTVVESRDPKKPVQFVLHADEVYGRTVTTGKKQTGAAELRGNIRYKITQKTKTGVVQVIEGTAGHADYDEAAARIRLTRGVRATITNEAELKGPAPVRSDNAVIHTGDSRQIELTGAADVNDIRFTLRDKTSAKGKEPAQSVAGAAVHLHGFQAGDINVGHSATLTGEGSTADFTDPAQDGQGTLTANRIAASFDKTLIHANAKGIAHFYYDRPEKQYVRPNKQQRTDKQEERQSLTGHADMADYDAEQHVLTLTGGVVADFSDPVTLLEPARMIGGKVVAHVVAPYHYEITGPAERNSLVFRPRPAEPRLAPGAPTLAKAEQAKPVTGGQSPFAVGIVHVTGFDTATYEPGKDVVLTGDRTTYRSEDAKTQTSSVLQSSHLTATLGADQTLQELTAVGNVRFELRQPFPSGKGVQITKGTATRAIMTNAKGEEVTRVPGPFLFDRSREDTQQPDSFQGQAGDTLTYNVTTGKISGDTPNGTIVWIHPVSDVDASKKTAGRGAAQPEKKRN